MSKTNLIASIAAKSGLTQSEVKARMKPALECMLEALKNGNRITIYNFGMFDVKEYGERKSRNPYWVYHYKWESHINQHFMLSFFRMGYDLERFQRSFLATLVCPVSA